MANHKYNYDSSPASEKVVRFVGHRKRVMEIGCGPGAITKVLHNDQQCSIIGLELDDSAIAIVAPYCDKVIQVDLNAVDWNSLHNELGVFDVILAADVLEHLYDPWSTLSRLPLLLKKGGSIVVSLPHVGYASIAGCLLIGDFQYRDCGLLDNTHIRFFCLKNIDELFVRAKLKIVDVSYVIISQEHSEWSSVWNSLKPRVQKVLQETIHSDIYQVVVKAVPIDAEGEEISVESTASKLFGNQQRSMSRRERVLRWFSLVYEP